MLQRRWKKDGKSEMKRRSVSPIVVVRDMEVEVEVELRRVVACDDIIRKRSG